LPVKLSDNLLRTLQPPASGYYLIWDSGTKGFGVRITTAGAKSFVFNYRVRETGRERRKTIGQYPAWSVAAARKEADRLKQLRDQGHDPMGELHAKRGAPTVADLADFYCEHHLPTLRPSSQREARDMLRDHILPKLGQIKVANVKQSDVAALHRRMSTIPYLMPANSPSPSDNAVGDSGCSRSTPARNSHTASATSAVRSATVSAHMGLA
jgi:hypothetical protein